MQKPFLTWKRDISSRGSSVHPQTAIANDISIYNIIQYSLHIHVYSVKYIFNTSIHNTCKAPRSRNVLACHQTGSPPNHPFTIRVRHLNCSAARTKKQHCNKNHSAVFQRTPHKLGRRNKLRFQKVLVAVITLGNPTGHMEQRHVRYPRG